MSGPQPVVRPWPVVALAAGWHVPVVARAFVRLPLWSVLLFVAWGLAVVIALAWALPASRRVALVPDAAARGGASKTLAASVGMASAGLIAYSV